MNDLKVTLIQYDIAWESPRENRNILKSKIQNLKNTDVIVLPEMFTTGFSMNPEKYAEDPGGETVLWMQEIAAMFKVLLMGSIITRKGNNYYNRLYCADGVENKIYFYDKRHLFRMGEENNHYTGGKERVVFSFKGWRILPLICYDLRFPVWSRNRNDYDLLVYVANWPDARSFVWKNLLIARALENQSYVVGLNRVGEDGQGLSYSGDSMIIDAKGRILDSNEERKEDTIFAELFYDDLKTFRDKFPVWMDADDFTLNNSV